jgi:hypothetical protein
MDKIKEFFIEIIFKRIVPLIIILFITFVCIVFCILVFIFIFLPIWIPLFIISRMRKDDSGLDKKNYADVVQILFGFFCIFGSDYLPEEKIEKNSESGYVEY